MPSMAMEHEADPADLIRKKIGKLEDITIFSNYLLLGVYERPEKTKSGLYISDQTRKEDQYQGKAGLVLKKGPFAFRSDEHFDFKGQDVNVGDWVAIFVTDGRPVVVNGQLCRLVQDQHIRLKITTPDQVF
jgi:co-chaperonin GroES (HSP10)